MKRTYKLLTTLLVLALATGVVQAQHAHQQNAPDPAPAPDMMQGMQDMQGMMQGMMHGMMQGKMHGMMQEPLHQSGMLVFMLPTMGEQLGLSHEQVAALAQQKKQFLATQQQTREARAEKQAALKALFEAGTPPPEKVEALLVETATLEARRQAAWYRVAASMKAVLTPEQGDRLRAMKPAEMHQHMMAGMSMMDMMQMMKALHGEMMGHEMMGMMKPDVAPPSGTGHNHD